MRRSEKSERKSTKEDEEEEDDGLAAFHPSLWRMPEFSSSIPRIAVNEQQLELEDYEPTISSGTTSSERSEGLSRIKAVLQSEDENSPSSSIGETNSNNQRIIRGSIKDGDSKGYQHLKWRRKLLVLVWFNLLIRYRNRFKTFVELLFPLIALGFILGGLVLNNNSTWSYNDISADDSAVLLAKSDPFGAFNSMSAATLYQYVCANENICTVNSKREFHIVYSPNNTFTQSLMEDVRAILGLGEDTETSRLFGVPSPEALHKALRTHWETTDPVPVARYPIGIVFSLNDISNQTDRNGKSPLKNIEDGEEVPRKLKYTIRSYFPDIANTAENFPFVEHNSGLRTRHDVSPYIYTGFAGMQTAIDLAFIKKVAQQLMKYGGENKDLETTISSLVASYETSRHVRMLEYPFFLDAQNRIKSWSAVVLTFLLSYACSNYYVVQDICSESKSGNVELLKLHGLTPSLHWIAYGITSALMRIPTTLGMAFILHVCISNHALIEYQHPLIIWLFLFLHSIAQNCENFFTAHFFKNPTNGGMAVIAKSIASFLLPLRLYDRSYISRIPNIVLCLFSPQWNLANGLYSFLQYEIYEEGLHWYDFPVLIDVHDYINIATQLCCMILVYSIFIFFLLTVYADKIVTKTNSPGLSWRFCCDRFLRPKPETQKPTPPINYSEMPRVFEKPPPDLLCSIKVRHLCKTYGSERSYKIALDNISLDIHEGEITAIMGMSGSGKTSLLNAIGGLIDPTSGYVEMKNLKVHEYSDYLNQFMSIVPQKCTLFASLSTEDHVRFCCMIHGISYRKSKNQAKALLQLFNLTGWKSHGHLWLSETHIKKLAMAMALASAPTILLLDEPCKGMDTESTKQFWEILTSLKKRRTIIIASSRTQETELYCDRMAFISNGKLLCYATPGKIRRHYGIGSVLNLREAGEELNTAEVMKLIDSEISGTEVLSPIGYEEKFTTHRYLLPFGQPYAALLERLEDAMSDLKYSKMWMSRAEMGSIFLKISLSSGPESTWATKEAFILDSVSKGSFEFGHARQKHTPIDDCVLSPTAGKQFSALFVKKWLSMSQRDPFIVSEFIIPFLLMMLLMFFSPDFLQFDPESLAKPLHIGMHSQTLTPIREASSTTFSDVWFKAFIIALNDTPTELVRREQDMLKYLEKGKLHHLGNSKQQIIVAFERDDLTTTGYYSAHAYHSCPIALNTIANAFLDILSINKENPYSIRISNYPEHQYEGFQSGSTQSNSTTVFAFIISLIMAMIAAAELRLPIVEKQHDIKNMEFMLGVHPTMYWYTSFAGDFVRNLFVVTILMGIICIFDYFGHSQFSGVEERLIIALIMFGYLCWSSIPYSYFITELLSPNYLGYGHFLVLHFVLGIFPKIVTYQILRTQTDTLMLYVRYILHISPPYTITSALVHYLNIVSERHYCNDESYQPICNDYEMKEKGAYLSPKTLKDIEIAGDYNSLFRSCCKAYCEPEGICHLKRDFFIHAPVPALRADMTAMLLQGILYWIIVILIEHNVPRNIWFYISSRICGNKEVKEAEDDTRNTDEPEDVKQEHERVDNMVDVDEHVESEVLFVQDVTKFYNTKKVIDHAYFSTPVGCITGILGLSKSGLTTLLQLLTGQMKPTSGHIFLFDSHYLQPFKSRLSSQIGFCSQINACYPDLTGFQTLQMMAKLRGIPDLEIDVQVSRWIEHFELDDDAHVRCKSYRQGMVRRLCCAMAMIGNPRILILDNPSLGMDLAEQHIFWKAITRAREKGQTIIFTSSNCDEIQRCSQKVIVLDKGAISTIGRHTDVFRANSRGLILSLRSRNQAFKKLNVYQMAAKVDQLRDHIIRHLSPCDLLLEEGNILVYHLKDLTTKLSYAYGIMEGAMETFPSLLDHFHIAEPSLDDVILNYRRRGLANMEGIRRTILEDDRNNSV